MRCLILGCSRTKIESPELLPAIERYDGPPYRVLRRYLSKNQSDILSLDIYVLSAKFGLIDGRLCIENYDQKMTMERAAQLNEGVIDRFRVELLPRDYDEIFLSMGKTYLQALIGIDDLIDKQTSVIKPISSSGKQLTELRNWLWGQELPPTKSKETQIASSHTVPQTVVLRGSTITMTTGEAVQLLGDALETNKEGAYDARSWYADISGERVSPKWAAHTLFDLPVSKFSADEARRALRRLGINCYKQ